MTCMYCILLMECWNSCLFCTLLECFWPLSITREPNAIHIHRSSNSIRMSDQPTGAMTMDFWKQIHILEWHKAWDNMRRDAAAARDELPSDVFLRKPQQRKLSKLENARSPKQKKKTKKQMWISNIAHQLEYRTTINTKNSGTRDASWISSKFKHKQTKN